MLNFFLVIDHSVSILFGFHFAPRSQSPDIKCNCITSGLNRQWYTQSPLENNRRLSSHSVRNIGLNNVWIQRELHVMTEAHVVDCIEYLRCIIRVTSGRLANNHFASYYPDCCIPGLFIMPRQCTSKCPRL